jgi:hypothetical protein
MDRFGRSSSNDGKQALYREYLSHVSRILGQASRV